LRITEDLIVFGETGVNYYPQMTKGKMQKKGGHNGHPTMSDLKPYMEYKNDIYYPTNILTRANGDKLNRLHPTQKPLDLLRYLILTYTNPGDLVLDFAMGSGTTLVAAKQLGRKAIGIELDERYVNIAIDRLQQEVLNLV
jgi:site-specific DNA-methyltransferase (adenine-specific)